MRATKRPKQCFKGQQKSKDAEKEKEQDQDAEEADQDAEEADEEPKQPNQLKPRQDETKQPEYNHTHTRGAMPKEEEILRRDSECLHLYILIVCIY